MFSKYSIITEHQDNPMNRVLALCVANIPNSACDSERSLGMISECRALSTSRCETTQGNGHAYDIKFISNLTRS